MAAWLELGAPPKEYQVAYFTVVAGVSWVGATAGAAVGAGAGTEAGRGLGLMDGRGR